MPKAKWTKDQIKDLLKTNDRAVVKGLVCIYDLQTEDEQICEYTQHANGVGFNSCDGDFFTGVAKRVKNRGNLTEKQFNKIKKGIMKYAGQLAKVANGKIVITNKTVLNLDAEWLVPSREK